MVYQNRRFTTPKLSAMDGAPRRVWDVCTISLTDFTVIVNYPALMSTRLPSTVRKGQDAIATPVSFITKVGVCR